MKTLNFTEENKDCFDLLYETVMGHPVSGIEQILKAAVVVEKLKSIGEPGEKTNDFTAYKLKTVPATLELEDSYFAYLKESFNSAQIPSSLHIELLAKTAKLLKSVDT